MNRYTILLTVGLSTLIIDQISKAYIIHYMDLHQSIVIIPNFFSFTFIKNPGAAFGFLSDAGETFRLYFFVSASILAMIFLGSFFYKTPSQDRWTLTALSLVMGGAVGNLLDRIQMGEVTDFLDFYIGAHHWPAFNMADSGISVGMGLLLFQLFFRPEHSAIKQTPEDHTHLSS